MNTTQSLNDPPRCYNFDQIGRRMSNCVEESYHSSGIRFGSLSDRICGNDATNISKVCLGTKPSIYLPKYKIKAHKAAVKAISFLSSDLLITGGGSADKTLRVWDLARNQEKSHLYTSDKSRFANSSSNQSLDSLHVTPFLTFSNNNISEILHTKKTFSSQITNIQITDQNIFTSHGYSQNDIKILSKRSLNESVILRYHKSRVLHFGIVGETVVSMSGNEMCLWNIGETVDEFIR